jgi:hypothetical protein
MAVDSPISSLNSLRFPPKAPKNPESLSLPKSLSPNKRLIPFCGLLYSSPDVPFILPACPTSFHTPPDIATKL